MANTALYYPYINPPADEWTIRSVLYWDRIESIIPMGTDIEDSTKALIDEGLLAPVNWIDVAAVGREIADDFVQYIHSQHKHQRLVKDWRASGSPPQIHTMKMPHKIVQALQETELGFEQSYDWWAVRPDIASAYMSTLAWGLASQQNSRYDLLTDRGSALDSFSIAKSNMKHPSRLIAGKGRDAIEKLLKDVFLVPKALPSARELRYFKEQFGNELSTFRNHVNNQVLGVLSETNQEFFEERLTATRSDLVTQTTALQRRLAPSKLELVKATVLPSLGSIATYLMAMDFRLAMALPVVLTLSESLRASVMQQTERQDSITGSPMAYAALFNDHMNRVQRKGYRILRR